jgi:putative addiction module component (TIGR02574 family)
VSKAEILEEIPKLSAEERAEIRLKLDELDESGWLNSADELTDDEKALLEARIADYQRDPEAGSSWEEVEARIRAQLRA